MRCQSLLCPDILDFYSPGAELSVEVNGWLHNMDIQHDAWLAAKQIARLRITEAEVPSDAYGRFALQ